MTGGQKRALVILALALCVVSALLWLPAREDREEHPYQALFAGLEATEIQRIVLRHGDQEEPLVLERVDDVWQIMAPQELLADAWRAEALSSSIAQIQARAPMPSAAPADYGLDGDGVVSIQLTLSDGEEHSLVVGDPAPVGGGTYILVAGEVRVAQGMLAGSLDATLDGLRERRVWRTAPVEADFAAVERGDLRLEAVRSEEGWRDGSGQPLDTEEMESWLRALTGLRAAAFGPPPGPLLPLGRIEVRTEDGQVQVLSVGRGEGSGERWWQGSGQPVPVILDDAGMEPLEEGLRILGSPSEAAPPS